MPADIPAWFRGALLKPDPMTAECSKCGAPAGQRCRYTTAGGIHKALVDGRMQYVDNEVGAEMQGFHTARHAAARAALFEPGSQP